MTVSRDIQPAAVAGAALTTRAPVGDYSDRLNFALPPFLRMAWATAAARDRWSGPLNRLVEDVRTSEWLAVAAKVRAAAIIVVPRAQSATLAGEWSKHQLVSRVLGGDDAAKVHAFNGKTPKLSPADDIHLVTRSDRMAQLEAVWRSADTVRTAGWLGYPPCCAAFLKSVVAERRCVDTTWAMVQSHTKDGTGARLAEITGPVMNPLLSALGLRAAPHRPCGFRCQATQSLAAAYTVLRTRGGSLPNKGALEEVLGWPVEWSSLHGIVEVKLPILKLCYEGDATASTYKVRLMGGELPEHTAQGLDFPHRQPTRIRKRTDIN